MFDCHGDAGLMAFEWKRISGYIGGRHTMTIYLSRAEQTYLLGRQQALAPFIVASVCRPLDRSGGREEGHYHSCGPR